MAQRILIAPLDWGLGHTVRCIPIIQKHLQKGDEIVFAGTKQQQEFISQHQITIKCIDLFGYAIQYSAKLPQWLKIALQLPKILSSIKQEKKWLDELLIKNKFDLIISDNRYGLYNEKINSVILSHQLAPVSPIFSRFIHKKIASFINCFNECWIPDDEQLNYSGKLSQNKHIVIPIKKIGLLTRFKKDNLTNEIVHDVLILLSGIEPQRSILEIKLLNEFKNSNLKICLVRGINDEIISENNIRVYKKINSIQLNKLIHQSRLVICRSGYTSIMELLPITKNIILIPTPGQTEQEYLAQYVNLKFGINYLRQQQLNLLHDHINRLLN